MMLTLADAVRAIKLPGKRRFNVIHSDDDAEEFILRVRVESPDASFDPEAWEVDLLFPVLETVRLSLNDWLRG